MFLVTNRLLVAPGWEKELESRFEKRRRSIENEPGFVRMVVLRPVSRRKNRKTGEYEETETTSPYQIQTWWKSEEDFWAWTKSESFAAAHRETPPKEMYSGPASLEIHEVAQDSQ